jgi:hypothetical protein
LSYIWDDGWLSSVHLTSAEEEQAEERKKRKIAGIYTSSQDLGNGTAA